MKKMWPDENINRFFLRDFIKRKDISRNLGTVQPKPLFDSEKIIAVDMKGSARKKIRKFGLNKL